MKFLRGVQAAVAAAIVLANTCVIVRAEEPREITPDERAEVLALLHRFDERFAETLDLEHLMPEFFVDEPFGPSLEDEFADFGPAVDELLGHDSARRRRIHVALANLGLLFHLACLSTCDVDAERLPPHPEFERLDAAVDAHSGALRSATTRAEAEIAFDALMTDLELLTSECENAVPRGATSRDLFRANREALDEGSGPSVRTAEGRRGALGPAFAVVWGRLYFLVERTAAGLKLVEIGVE